MGPTTQPEIVRRDNLFKLAWRGQRPQRSKPNQKRVNRDLRVQGCGTWIQGYPNREWGITFSLPFCFLTYSGFRLKAARGAARSRTSSNLEQSSRGCPSSGCHGTASHPFQPGRCRTRAVADRRYRGGTSARRRPNPYVSQSLMGRSHFRYPFVFLDIPAFV